jgi:hypothetical protein
VGHLTDWEVDCLRWHGRVLTGNDKHWCADWDYLPIDDTCIEYQACAEKTTVTMEGTA